MAELTNRLDITVEELEEKLGYSKLPEFIKESEELFVSRTDAIADEICKDPAKRAIFISGPTSSGKTTFTLRLTSALAVRGRAAAHLSLDDYYNTSDIVFDKDGRPDFETIDSLDMELAAQNVKSILEGKEVLPPLFDFKVRERVQRSPNDSIVLPKNGVIIVEGLHGLSKIMEDIVPKEQCVKIFIMPYGNVYCDTKLMDSREIRLLRRIVRDYRHRDSHALATVDYWPMIERSEEKLFDDYMKRADYHVNSFLAYESLVIAPMALHDIREAFEQVSDGNIRKSVFMERNDKGKSFANLSEALKTMDKLVEHLEKIPRVDPSRVPPSSILNEFISDS